MGLNLDNCGYQTVSPVLPGEFPSLSPGGYICTICSASFQKSKSGNDMLVLFIDIADGEFKDFFKNAAKRVKNFDTSKQWDNSGIYRQVVFDNVGRVTPFFRGLLECIQKSNPNSRINSADFEPDSLRGKLCGFIFAQEEYTKKDSSIGTRVFAKFPKTVDDIRNGNFKIPSIKKVNATAKPAQSEQDIFGGTDIDPSDVPF